MRGYLFKADQAGPGKVTPAGKLIIRQLSEAPESRVRTVTRSKHYWHSYKITGNGLTVANDRSLGTRAINKYSYSRKGLFGVAINKRCQYVLKIDAAGSQLFPSACKI